MLLSSINTFLYNDFFFLPRYRVRRHVLYWAIHTLLWAGFWVAIGASGPFGVQVINMLIWVPIFILYGYPMAYWAVPQYLLKAKILQFLLIILAWGIAGLYIDVWYKDYIMIPIQELLHPNYVLPKGQQAWCYLCITTAAAGPMAIKFFTYWNRKKEEWLEAQQGKMTAELQLLKAQVHPHFLFNTLNNIYAFSLERSPKTPGLILKLSSLLSYMLYDCKADEVRQEKELEIMRNYIELERERYGELIDISWKVAGEIRDQFIAPLMILPFIENAFKHGTSEQIEQSWLSVDISVRNNKLSAKIANSKNESTSSHRRGIGIANVQKRLELIYPGNYELKINDEGRFFVVAMMIGLKGRAGNEYSAAISVSQTIKHEDPLPAYR